MCIGQLFVVFSQARRAWQRDEFAGAASDDGQPVTGTMLRTLLYVTTHLSEWHTSGLRCLWPAAARRARLLRDADVVVFNSGRPATAAQLAAVAAAFPRYNNRSVEIFSAEATRQVHRKAFTLGSTKKQMGAILALSEAEARGWFDGYDWVVRSTQTSSSARTASCARTWRATASTRSSPSAGGPRLLVPARAVSTRTSWRGARRHYLCRNQPVS